MQADWLDNCSLVTTCSFKKPTTDHHIHGTKSFCGSVMLGRKFGSFPFVPPSPQINGCILFAPTRRTCHICTL